MNHAPLTVERARERMDYDATTGIFRWRSTHGSAKVGAVAGCHHCRGYWQISVDGRLYLAHRLAWLMAYGCWPGGEIDHRDGDRANNRITNLRECCRQENMQNVHVAMTSSRTGLLGVIPVRDRFWARIHVNGRSRHLGVFRTAEEAHDAYLAAKAELHPFADMEHIL